MKPEQFIREFGVEKARDLLDQLHKLGCPDDMKITVINGMWQRTSNGFTYPELKRLVESVELVEVCGGLVEAKKKMNSESLRSATIEYVLYKAIRDHESIYGASHE
ncbi:hypothetical protein QM268_02910 [Acinetobacter baumannii]|nr:hypothetical protein [Acinetobacter baumannii]MDI9691415.1 hypothetical protein [Acinetobacter baumannii]